MTFFVFFQTPNNVSNQSSSLINKYARRGEKTKKTNQSQRQMDGRRPHNDILVRQEALHHSQHILSHSLSLPDARPRGLVRPAVRDIAHGVQVRVMRVSKLQRRAHANEAVRGVDERVGGGWW